MSPEPCPYALKDADNRVIGVEITGIYDGILYWQCADCGHRWHRWPPGHPLRARADLYVVTI